jgi:hypothetical protein
MLSMARMSKVRRKEQIAEMFSTGRYSRDGLLTKISVASAFSASLAARSWFDL